jgi:hypothetical protein
LNFDNFLKVYPKNVKSLMCAFSAAEVCQSKQPFAKRKKNTSNFCFSILKSPTFLGYTLRKSATTVRNALGFVVNAINAGAAQATSTPSTPSTPGRRKHHQRRQRHQRRGGASNINAVNAINAGAVQATSTPSTPGRCKHHQLRQRHQRRRELSKPPKAQTKGMALATVASRSGGPNRQRPASGWLNYTNR